MNREHAACGSGPGPVVEATIPSSLPVAEPADVQLDLLPVPFELLVEARLPPRGGRSSRPRRRRFSPLIPPDRGAAGRSDGPATPRDGARCGAPSEADRAPRSRSRGARGRPVSAPLRRPTCGPGRASTVPSSPARGPRPRLSQPAPASDGCGRPRDGRRGAGPARGEAFEALGHVLTDGTKSTCRPW